MQPEKPTLEDCDLDTIYRNISKNTQTAENDSISSVKSNRLPLPRDLELGQRNINVVSNSNKVEKVTCNLSQQTKQSKYGKKSKTPTNFKDPYQRHIFPHSHKVIKGNGNQEKSLPKYLNKKLSKHCIGDRKSTPSLQNLTYQKEIINSKKHVPIYSCSYSSALDGCHDVCSGKSDKYLRNECEKYLARKCSVRQGERSNSYSSICPTRKSSHKNLDRKKSSKKHLKRKKNYCKDLCNKESDKYLKRQCEKYLARKFSNRHSIHKSSHRRSSHKDVYCRGRCKEKYLRKECEKYLDRKLSRHYSGDSKSPSYSSLPRRGSKKRRSHKDVHKRKSSHKSLKKRKSLSQGICNEKHLKKECEEYLRRKCTRKHSDGKYSSHSSICPTQKRSHKSLHKKKSSDKNLRNKSSCTECYDKKHSARKHSRKRSRDKSSTCSSICPGKKNCHVGSHSKKSKSRHRKSSSHKDLSKKKSPCKGICKDKYLLKECEKYLDRKLSQNHLGDRKSHSYSSLEYGSMKKDKLHRKKSPCRGVCKDKYLKNEGKRHKHRKHSRKDSEYRTSSRSVCQDVCNPEVSATCQQKKDSYKEFSKKHSLENLCKECCKNKKKKRHEDIKKKRSSQKSSLCLPLQETRTQNRETSNDSKTEESGDTKNLSQVCIYVCPCKKGKMYISQKECDNMKSNKSFPDAGITKMSSVSGKEENGSSVSVQSLCPTKMQNLCPRNLNAIENNEKNNLLALQLNDTSEHATSSKTIDKMHFESSNKLDINRKRNKMQPYLEISSLDSNSLELDTTDSDNKTASASSTKSSIDSYSISQINSKDSLSQYSTRSSANSDDTLLSKNGDHVLHPNQDRAVPQYIPRYCSHTDNKRPKSVMDAHCETMATIKYAMKDLICKVYKTTSDIVSEVQTETANQLEAIRNFKCDDETESCKPRKCYDSNVEGTLTNLVNVIRSNNSKEAYSGELLRQHKISDDNHENDITVDNLNTCSFNGCVSKYDNNPNLLQIRNHSMELPYVLNTTSTSTNNMFTSLKSKILSMFSEKDDNDKMLSSNESSTSVSKISMNDAESD